MTNSLKELRLEDKNFTFIDVSGHQEHISNMIAGSCRAECGILVIDALPGDFESGFKDGQTKEHAILARELGIT